jgi:hypothetical protein
VGVWLIVESLSLLVWQMLDYALTWNCFIARLCGGHLLFFLTKKVGKKVKTPQTR